MNYIKDGLYPITESAIRAAHPQMSFPQIMTPEHVADLGYFPVESTAIPSYDAVTETVTEGAPQYSGGAWHQAWSIVARPQDQIDAALDAQERHALMLAAKATGMFDQLKAASLVQIDAWVETNFSTLNATQRNFLKLLAAGVVLYLRER